LIVIDSSYALALVMPDERRPASMAATVKGRLVAPSVWPLEVANALRNGVRRGRLRDNQVPALCADLGEFAIEIVAPTHVLALRHFEAAAAHDLTPYDASYLELALLRRCALATLDQDLARAAERAGLAVHL